MRREELWSDHMKNFGEEIAKYEGKMVSLVREASYGSLRCAILDGYPYLNIRQRIEFNTQRSHDSVPSFDYSALTTSTWTATVERIEEVEPTVFERKIIEAYYQKKERITIDLQVNFKVP